MKLDKNFSCGHRIRQLRTERALSQERLALIAGITPAYLGQIERGKRNVTVSVIERLCQAMTISLSDFFTESNTIPHAENEIDTQILAQLVDLSPKEKITVLQIIKNVMALRKGN